MVANYLTALSSSAPALNLITFLAKAYPGAVYEMIDVERSKYNISGTMCRAMNEEERAKWII